MVPQDESVRIFVPAQEVDREALPSGERLDLASKDRVAGAIDFWFRISSFDGFGPSATTLPFSRPVMRSPPLFDPSASKVIPAWLLLQIALAVGRGCQADFSSWLIAPSLHKVFFFSGSGGDAPVSHLRTSPFVLAFEAFQAPAFQAPLRKPSLLRPRLRAPSSSLRATAMNSLLPETRVMNTTEKKQTEWNCPEASLLRVSLL